MPGTADLETEVERMFRRTRDLLDSVTVDGDPPTVVGHAETPDGLIKVDFAIGAGVTKLEIAPVAMALEPGYLADLVQSVVGEALDDARASLATLIRELDRQMEELRTLLDRS